MKAPWQLSPEMVASLRHIIKTASPDKLADELVLVIEAGMLGSFFVGCRQVVEAHQYSKDGVAMFCGETLATSLDRIDKLQLSYLAECTGRTMDQIKETEHDRRILDSIPMPAKEFLS